MAVEEFLMTYDERAAELEQQALHAAAFIATAYSRECATEDLTRFFNPLQQSTGRDVEVSISRRDISRTTRLKAAAQRRLRRVGRRVVGARP